MIRRRVFFLIVGFTCFGVVAVAAGAVVTQIQHGQAAPPRENGMPQDFLPAPPQAAAFVHVDRSKEEIERPAKQVIAKNSGVTATAEAGQPKVAPGNVRWHATFAAACEAARKSGKAVLLFQMMGKLDEQFC